MISNFVIRNVLNRTIKCKSRMIKNDKTSHTQPKIRDASTQSRKFDTLNVRGFVFFHPRYKIPPVLKMMDEKSF